MAGPAADSTDRALLSAVEIAKITGLAVRTIRWRASRQSWAVVKRGKKGAALFAASALPSDIRDASLQALNRKILESAPASPTSPSTNVDTSSSKAIEAALAADPAAGRLTTWQREVATARKTILDELRRVAAAVGVNRAIGQVIKLAGTGALPERLQRLVRTANARRGEEGARTLSRTSVFRWMSLEATRGCIGLAPAAPSGERAIPAWVPAFLKAYQTPQKPTIAYCAENLDLPAGVPAPSYHQVCRFLAKVSKVDLQRGRLGPQALRTIRLYVRRDTSHMQPGDAYISDGHTFDAEVAHPAHGRPFRPEITLMLDIATRRAVGWSAGLAESTWTVADALRNACETSGVPAIWYADRGAGNQNKVQLDESVGLCARLGIEIARGRPRNPQGHGLSERSHQSIWVRAAKLLPTYMGAAMDREARNTIYKITRADLKAAGTSRLLMPWPEFLRFCAEQVAAYNARPHRGNARIRDAETGRLRHFSPDEAWQQARVGGWQPVKLSPDDASDLFRPYKFCAVRRAQVQLFGNFYFDASLDHYHGEHLAVGYDIHDASRVWVRDRAGRLICVAQWEANRRAYFPQSFIDQARAKRAEGRMARAQAKIDEARAELRPSAVIDQAPDLQMELAEEKLAEATRAALARREPLEAIPENVEPLAAREAPDLNARPFFDTDAGKYRWLLSHPGQICQEDQRWIAWYRETGEWFDLFSGEPIPDNVVPLTLDRSQQEDI